MNTIKLQNPIMINGKEVKELSYDTSAITAEQFCQAEVANFAAHGNQITLAPSEFDHGLHLYLGMMAVIAVNPHIDVKDLERVKGFDMIKLVKVGQNFILTGAGGSDQKTSADTSETTQEPSTQAQK